MGRKTNALRTSINEAKDKRHFAKALDQLNTHVKTTRREEAVKEAGKNIEKQNAKVEKREGFEKELKRQELKLVQMQKKLEENKKYAK